MKTMNQLATALLTAVLLAVTPNAFGQKAEEHLSQQNYRLNFFGEESGNKEVIEKSFYNRDEMQNYFKEHNPQTEDFSETTPPPAEEITPHEIKHSTGETAKHIRVVVAEKRDGKEGKKKKSQRLSNGLSSTNTVFIIEKKVSASSKSTPTWQTAEEAILPDPSGGGQKEPPLSNADPSTGTPLSELSLYPNPSGGNFHVSFRVAQPTDVILRMSDINGKQVYFNLIRNHQGLFEKDIFFAGGLPKGTYLLEAIAGEQRVTTRVVVQ